MTVEEFSYTITEILVAVKLELDEQEYVILVEGRNDKNFYFKNFNFDERRVYFFYPPLPTDNNKEIILNLIKVKQTFAKFCAIVDADFDRITNKIPKQSNIFLTDYHDLEMGIFMSNAINKILDEINIIKRVILEKFIKKLNGSNFREIIFKKSTLLAKLRFLNLSNNWNLSFKQLHNSNFFDYEYFDKEEKCIHYLLSYHNSIKKYRPLDTITIKNALKMYSATHQNFDYPQYCHGKDVCKIMMYYFNHDLRNRRKFDIDLFTVKLSHEESFFHQTNLYSNVVNWIKNN